MQTTEFKLEYLDIFDSDRWSRFTAESSHATVFQSTSYIQCVRQAFQRPVKTLAVLHRNQIMGGIVLYPRKKLGLSYGPAPYFIPYNGFILNDFIETSYDYRRISLQNTVLSMLQEELEKKYLYCAVRQSAAFLDLRLLIRNGWEIIPEYTVIFSLQEGDDLFSRVDRDQRRRIRKFETADLTFSENVGVDQLYPLMEKSYHSHGIEPPVAQEDWRSFSKLLIDNKLARLFGIKDGDDLLTALLTVEDKPAAYALFSGRKPGSEASSIEIYLFWKVIEYYRNEGFQTFDMLGAMVPSIARMKLELGGILRRSDNLFYYRNRLVHSLVALEKKMKNRERKITVGK